MSDQWKCPLLHKQISSSYLHMNLMAMPDLTQMWSVCRPFLSPDQQMLMLSKLSWYASHVVGSHCLIRISIAFWQPLPDQDTDTGQHAHTWHRPTGDTDFCFAEG